MTNQFNLPFKSTVKWQIELTFILLSYRLNMYLDINLLHTVIATLAAFTIGLIFYSPPLMGRKWAAMVKEYGHMNDEDLKPKLVKPILWLLTIFINAIVFQTLIQIFDIYTLKDMLMLGFLLWIGIGVTFSSWPVIFAKWKAGIWFINNVALLLMQIVMAVVFGVMG